MINGCQNQVGRCEIWKRVIDSIDSQKEIHGTLLKELKELPFEPAKF